MSVETTYNNLFSRQPLSTLSKIASRAFLVVTILAAIGAIVLTLAAGFNLDITLMTLCSMAATLLVGSGIRWLQALGILPGSYVFYIAFAQPYAFDSLSNPKDMHIGGYGHFVGNVVVGGLVIIAYGASIASVVQSYRQGNQGDQESLRAPRWLPTALGVVVGMVIGALLIGAIAQPPTVGTTYTNGVATVHLSANSFSEPAVTIAKGSKLMLVDDTSQIHILANGSWQNGTPKAEREPGAPVVNNLQLSGNSVQIGPFTTAGTYHIYCEVHSGMNLTIVVQ